MRRLLAVALVLLLSLALLAQSKPVSASSATAHALAEFKTYKFRAHMAFLADDLLEGRGTGTRGQEIAAGYVATQFALYGLKPAGDKDTYFQRVPFREIRVVPERCEAVIKHGSDQQQLKWGDDFIMGGDALRPSTNVEAPVVFVGYGVTAPGQNYDDYAGIDARGKIVAYLFGAPSRFSSEMRAHYGGGIEKRRNAAEHGAIGIIGLATPDLDKILPWDRIVANTAFPAFRWLDAKGNPNDTFPQLRAAASLSLSASKAFFGGSGKSFDEVLANAKASKPQSFELPVVVRLHVSSTHSEVTSPNVVAVLPGSDPNLKNEYVVYSAHTDHLGIGKPIKGDNIYNGAVDDASGVAAVLNLAEVFSHLPKAPARSILFLAATAEEAGLLGSDYFAHFPTVPKDAIVANLNIDGATVSYDFADIVALGADHSSLDTVVRRGAAQMHVKVSPDPMPEQVGFVRGDQYSFVRQGVPSVNIFEGLQAVDPKINGRKFTENWIEKYYHSPFDDMNQPLNFGAAVKYMKLNFLVGNDIANAPARPTWNKGDFFGELFAKHMSSSE